MAAEGEGAAKAADGTVADATAAEEVPTATATEKAVAAKATEAEAGWEANGDQEARREGAAGFVARAVHPSGTAVTVRDDRLVVVSRRSTSVREATERDADGKAVKGEYE